MNKLTKVQYDYLKSCKFMYNRINAEGAKGAGFTTAKEAKSTLENILTERETRKERKESYPVGIQDGCCYIERHGNRIHGRMDKVMNSKTIYCIYFKHIAYEMLPALPTHYDLRVEVGDTFDIKVYKFPDYDGYAKSYTHPMQVYDINVCVPRSGVKRICADGITMWVTGEKKIGNVVIYTGKCVRKVGRSFDYELVDVVCAENDSVITVGDTTFRNITAHGATAHEAIKSLKEKIERMVRTEQRRLTTLMNSAETKRTLFKEKYGEDFSVDTVITPEIYQFITGACTFGTNSWLKEFGYTREDSLRAGDLLPLIKGRYGYETFKAMLEC